MDHNQIAQSLIESEENIILIYAFNSTGKTRLSIAYKDKTKREDGSNTGIYYNAFSEDLFVWENDSENEGKNVRLNIRPSILNKFHSPILEKDVSEYLSSYFPKYSFHFNSYPDPEKGIESLSFFPEQKETKEVPQNSDEHNTDEEGELKAPETGDVDFPIKISRGEERIFVWCFLLTLFEREEFFQNQSDYIFIDDPVSSLDEHNIFITASLILELIEKNLNRRKIIITTHHAGLYSLLSDWMQKGEKRDKFYKKIKKDGNEIIKPKFQLRILKQESNGNLLILENKKDVFLYHLRLFQVLDEAKTDNSISPYHFALLRQLLENVSSFLGKGIFNYVLDRIEVSEVNHVADRINALSHRKVYSLTTDMLNDNDRKIFDEVFEKLKSKFGFYIN
ncbi:AAA family ATPase [Leptospira stimsonii]|uniref:Anticodon nuclease n=1 Tax=Leptospira stimsonii TaxID=2202203 RepID=A0ABY2MVI8_9LEPT|nr:AAA family ATPase [Leptospira stimsonii]TGK18392.1 anticodon nuclease [Leptospira stimsonii]TGM09641.1 anticodon nuclease [Leptospira stimsonii]